MPVPTQSDEQRLFDYIIRKKRLSDEFRLALQNGDARRATNLSMRFVRLQYRESQ